MTALLVIPARGGSRGVPRKNVRVLAGKPLLCHVIDTALQVPDARVVVTTDDDEIATVASRYDAVTVLRRPPHLSGADGPLDAIVYDAAQQAGDRYEPIVCLQPTSPFTTVEMILYAIDCVQTSYDTALTVRDFRGLRWEGDVEQYGNYPPRLPRQEMAPAWKETGAVFACRLDCLTPISRFGPRVRLIPVEGKEAIDIDTVDDWWIAEGYAHGRRIAYRVDGGGRFGLGHVYRALTLAHNVFGHNIQLFMDPTRFPAGVLLARSQGATVVELPTGTDDEWTQAIHAFDPEIVLLEIGATSIESVRTLQAEGRLVVTVEDRGPGAEVADLTFNDLDDPPSDGPQRYQGVRYAVLREEFLGVQPRPLKPTVERVLVTFGGTDPNRYTDKALEALAAVEIPCVDIVLGPDAEPPTMPLPNDWHLHRNVRCMSGLMGRADLAMTGCGRTTYELAACGVPVLCFPQNDHERKHIPVALQLGARVVPRPDQLQAAWWPDAVRECLALEWRERARARMAAEPLSGGADRMWAVILAAAR